MNLGRALSFCVKKPDHSTYLTAGGSSDGSVHVSSAITQRKCMRFGVQRQKTLLVTTELVIWRYANAFIFTNQLELDFGIAYIELTVQIKWYSNKYLGKGGG
jgi:hypothetical protein